MKETAVEHPFKVALVICGSVVFLGVMNMFVKLAAESLPIPQIMFFRSFIGVFPVLFLLWRRSIRRGDGRRGNGPHSGGSGWDLLKTRRPGGHFVRSLVGFFSMCCFFWSFAMLPLANATAIQFATPLIVTALSVVLLDEKVGPHRWTAVLIGLAAVLFMLRPDADIDPLGSLIAMCAAILAAFVLIIVRKLGSTEHSLTIVFYFTMFSAVFSGIWMLFVWQTPDWTNMLYLAAIGLLGGCGQICTTYAYAHAPVAFVSPFTYLTILISALLDILVWHQIPGWPIWAGSAVVIASGIYIVLREARRNYQPTALPEVADAPPPVPTEKDRETPV